MTCHTIRLSPASPGRFDVTGACQIEDTGTPIPDAARALRDAGADEHDLVVTSCTDCAVLPASIHSILKPRRKPLQSEIRAALGMNR